MFLNSGLNIKGFRLGSTLKGHTMQHSGHAAQHIFQNELMVEMYSMSLVRAISKVLHMKFS